MSKRRVMGYVARHAGTGEYLQGGNCARRRADTPYPWKRKGDIRRNIRDEHMWEWEIIPLVMAKPGEV